MTLISEERLLREIEAEAGRRICSYKVVLMAELGDLREGCGKEGWYSWQSWPRACPMCSWKGSALISAAMGISFPASVLSGGNG